jgi:hypothetical protein
LDRRLGGPHPGVDSVERRKIFPLPGLKLRPSSQSLYRLRSCTSRYQYSQNIHDTLKKSACSFVTYLHNLHSCNVTSWNGYGRKRSLTKMLSRHSPGGTVENHEERKDKKSTVCWYIMSYRPLKVKRRFGGTYRLLLQGPFKGHGGCPFLVSYWFARLCVRASGCLRFILTYGGTNGNLLAVFNFPLFPI